MIISILLQLLVIIGLILTYQWMLTDMTVLEAKVYLFTSTALAIIFCAIMVSQLSIIRKKYKVRESEEVEKYTLEYSSELFQELYRSSPVPYVVVDGEGFVESINFSCARLFDVSIDSLNGKNIFQYFGGEDEQKLALIPEYFKRGKFVNNVEIQIQRPDETIRWVLASLFSFTDAKGKRKGLLTLVDMTKQKLIDKAKTEFVSLASHQLRTPISGMKWNIELLLMAKSETLGPQEREYIEKIDRSLKHMDMLVNDFLSASKFELGTLTPSLVDVDIALFVQTIYEEHSPLALKKGITITTNVAATTIKSDTHLLHMIVSNLLGNAVKYTVDGGKVNLTVDTNEKETTIVVADSGIGIPVADQDSIFSKMFRASNTRTYAVEGTGLGLYIVKEAVKVLEGTITFTSKESVGTTFTVVLPKK